MSDRRSLSPGEGREEEGRSIEERARSVFRPVDQELRDVDANRFCLQCHVVATTWGDLLTETKAELEQWRATEDQREIVLGLTREAREAHRVRAEAAASQLTEYRARIQEATAKLAESVSEGEGRQHED